jgi:hypothetical protein
MPSCLIFGTPGKLFAAYFALALRCFISVALPCSKSDLCADRTQRRCSLLLFSVTVLMRDVRLACRPTKTTPCHSQTF